MKQKRKNKINKSQRRTATNRKVLRRFDQRNKIKKKRLANQIIYDFRKSQKIKKDLSHYKFNAVQSKPINQNVLANIDDRMFRNVNALVCMRRSERRRYFFLTGKAGKGIKGPKTKRYTLKSKYRC